MMSTEAGGCHKDKVTPAWTQTLDADLDPKVPFDNPQVALINM